jgi:hypothetical protein
MYPPKDLARGGFEILKEDGLREFAVRGGYFGYEQMLKGLFTASGKASEGDNIYEEDWDALIVLDGMRKDLLEETVEEFDFLGDDVESFDSLGSSSQEWMDRNFTDLHSEDLSDTVMVTGNAFSRTHLSEDDFQHMEEVWKYAWDEEKKAVMPEPITDAAIHYGREHEPDRMIVHYMQPHYPFLEDLDIGCGVKPRTFGEVNVSKQPWDELLLGDVTEEELWTAYKDNLRYVMDEVSRLTENLDAESAVITADHGNGMGRFNSEDLGVYGHQPGIAVNSLRKVPWIEVSAADTEEYFPGDPQENSDYEREEIMRALGYKE